MQTVAHLQASLGMSERRACRVVGADRKSFRYRSTRPDDADLRERLRALAAERRRFGYRRLHILLLIHQPKKIAHNQGSSRSLNHTNDREV